MPVKHAIILAGGMGTRLRDAVPDLPKCMAPVNGLPFLTYVIRHLLSQGIGQFTFSLGYKYEVIEEFLFTNYPTLSYDCPVEMEPLGTGGALRRALLFTHEKTVLVVNGDTLFKTRITPLSRYHEDKNAECTLALKDMKDFDRYGMVETDETGCITRFKEKQYYDHGYINAGMYILNTEQFSSRFFPEKFSLEKDYFEKYVAEKRFYGFPAHEYFIDIGIPADYERAQQELKYRPPNLKQMDTGWTLFLDRDGVINHEKQGDYIRNLNEFVFYDGALEALKILARKFGKIIVVSNQRGVGKGLMTEADLSAIHAYMMAEIEKAGGRIDKIYYCTSTDTRHPNRKPNPGMALLAKNDFPEIDLSKSIMVGNNTSDMLFGRNAGMFTVFLTTTKPDQELPHPDIDMYFGSLTEFAKSL
jgi:D-glycero-alpha-D-manno-heptose 1-phosphate guanylyltransferase